MAPQLRRDEYMVLWVYARPIELETALEMLDETHEFPLSDTSPLRVSGVYYVCGRVGEHNVVIAGPSSGQRAIRFVTSVVQQIKRLFTSLRFGLMVGIAGGVPSEEADIRLGDVVVGTHKTHGGVVEYDFGKSSSGFEHVGSLHAPPSVLLDAISNLQVEHRREKRKLDDYLSNPTSRLDSVRKPAGPDLLYAATYYHKGGNTCEQCDTSYLVDRKPRTEESDIVVHYGIIASGVMVMRSAEERDILSAKLGGVLCFETEIAGLINSFPCLVVRGICDYADSHKNKQWQPYAAATAAAYAKELLSVISRAEVVKMVTVDEAMRNLSDHPVIAERETPSSQKPSEQPVSGLEYTSIKDFIMEIAADGGLDFDSITWEWELPDIPASDMKNNVVLVCTHSRTHGDGNFEHINASTYGEYLKDSPWADFIIETLNMLARVERDLTYGEFNRWVRTNPPVRITSCSPGDLSINFGNKQTCLEILDLIEVLDWVCKSMHRPTNYKGHVVSSASYYLKRDAIARSSAYDLPESSATQTHTVWPCVRQVTSPLPKIKHSCWLPFFKSCVIVDSPFTPLDGSGEGLETSFNLMITLAAAECCLEIESSCFVFLGYRTLLYPVKIDGNCAHFHLITTAHGQIDPDAFDLKNIIPVEDVSQFKTMRCFVGWCEDAQINLGTRQLGSEVKYTGAKKCSRTLKFKGFSLLGQLGVPAPLAANLGVQPNFEFVTNDIRYTAIDHYVCLLYDTSQQPVILYDSKRRRCWLVPKLSVLLHMAQRYGPCSTAGMIPYAESYMDAEYLEGILRPAGQINVVTGQDYPLQLQSLLFLLNTRMSEVNKKHKKSGDGSLYGFEFMDVINNPDQGSYMKELKILSKSRTWLELVNAVGTVIVCSDLGDVISAEGSSTRKCKTCNTVPEDEDYFTATIPCLSRLAQQQGVDLIVGSNGIKLSDEAFWKLEMNPFISCNHEKDSRETCWERPGLIQQVGPKSSRLQKKSRPVQSHSVQSPLVNGAVVFR